MRTEPVPDRALLPAGSRVLCAVSGGADSVCLLHLLHQEADLTVLCAHFNHCLRGEASDGDEAFVRSLCADWGVPFFSERGDVAAWAAEHSLSLETAGRELRYAFLRRVAAELGADLIATAHTASDNAETMLLHLARGAGSRGLGGIPRRRDNIVRPLLDATRQEVEAYLTRRGIPWREDVTNSEDAAARNRLRHRAVPALKSVNAAFERNALRAAELLRQDDEYLSALAAEAWERLWDGEGVSAAGLLALPSSLAYRVLRRLAGGELSAEHFASLLELCRSPSPSARASLPGLTLRREYDRLLPGEAERHTLPPREVREGCCLSLQEAGLRLRAERLPAGTEIQSSFNTFSFSYDNICGKLFVTSRREGDRILLRGREGRRSLHRLMIDGRIPAERRDAVPVLRDEEGVLAVYGFGQAERAFASTETEQLRVTLERE